ncbi:TPA: hypothetical protein ACTR19_002551 [Yersinia enterocolitica]|uniref:hypothetical protein n=1 Tax=Yersinia enterocolitica TaxID=630 RepID=UPI0005E9D330|nr:hypothetical protein [Yersinia enterocolitica]CNL31245.1 Uncharacterised protein [Yersinia enterocolitica]HEN3443002.1 hypothetical protein [Yersinia enterocolitica]
MDINLEDALDFDLFEGDIGDGTERCLSDKIVKCRKPHVCYVCGSKIEPGQVARSSTWVFDGELHSYYNCETCVHAMVKSVNSDYDDEDPIHARYEVGEVSRAKREAQ